MTEIAEHRSPRKAASSSGFHTGSAASRSRARQAGTARLQPREGPAGGGGRLRFGQGNRPGGQSCQGAFPAWRDVAVAPHRVAFFRIELVPYARHHEAAHGEHGKVLSDAMGEVARGLEVIRLLLRDPGALEGRVLRAGLDGDRRLLDPPAARRRRRHHPVQLPRDGAHVDVGARARVWQHVRAQPSEKDPSASVYTAELLKETRRSRRRLQRRARRQGRGRRDPRAPGDQGGLLRRLDSDCEIRVRNVDEARQAHRRSAERRTT